MPFPLTRERLQKAVSYDPVTGNFTCIEGPEKDVGKIYGSRLSHGPLSIWVYGRYYLASRLAWLWVHGYYPDQQVFFIDDDSLNTAIKNLSLSNC
jgi:hypothetical protein